MIIYIVLIRPSSREPDSVAAAFSVLESAQEFVLAWCEERSRLTGLDVGHQQIVDCIHIITRQLRQ